MVDRGAFAPLRRYWVGVVWGLRETIKCVVGRLPHYAWQICSKPANHCRGRRPRRPVDGHKIYRTHGPCRKHCKPLVGANACHRPVDGHKNDWASVLCHAVGRPALWPPDGLCGKSYYGIHGNVSERSLRPQARFGGQPDRRSGS